MISTPQPIADHALETDAFILAAVAFPIFGRPEYLLAEETVALGFKRAVIDRFGFFDFTDDHARICSGDAKPMRIASKLLTSNKGPSLPSIGVATYSSFFIFFKQIIVFYVPVVLRSFGGRFIKVVLFWFSIWGVIDTHPANFGQDVKFFEGVDALIDSIYRFQVIPFKLGRLTIMPSDQTLIVTW